MEQVHNQAVSAEERLKQAIPMEELSTELMFDENRAQRLAEEAQAAAETKEYMDNRPGQKGKQAFDPATGQFVNPQEYHDKQRDIAYESSQTPYEEMTGQDLFTKFITAETQGDKTTQMNLTDILTEKMTDDSFKLSDLAKSMAVAEFGNLEAATDLTDKVFRAKITKEHNKQLNGRDTSYELHGEKVSKMADDQQATENRRQRVLTLKDKYLSQLQAADQSEGQPTDDTPRQPIALLPPAGGTGNGNGEGNGNFFEDEDDDQPTQVMDPVDRLDEPSLRSRLRNGMGRAARFLRDLPTAGAAWAMVRGNQVRDTDERDRSRRRVAMGLVGGLAVGGAIAYAITKGVGFGGNSGHGLNNLDEHRNNLGIKDGGLGALMPGDDHKEVVKAANGGAVYGDHVPSHAQQATVNHELTLTHSGDNVDTEVAKQMHGDVSDPRVDRIGQQIVSDNGVDQYHMAVGSKVHVPQELWEEMEKAAASSK